MKPLTTCVRSNHHAACLLAACALALAATTGARATITVTSVNDSGPGSLRQAISDAASGETIDFSVVGTITLTSGELQIAKNLTISGPGPTNLTVSGHNASRVFSLNNVTTAISGLTIVNGRVVTGHGAGISLNYGSLTLSNCVVSSNTNASAPINNYGGGIANFAGAVTVINCTIANNYAYVGAGCSMDDPTLRPSTAFAVLNSIIRSNSCGLRGGGLRSSYGKLYVVNSAIVGNFGGSAGGGIESNGSLLLTNSTVSANSLGAYNTTGGGVWLESASSSDTNVIVSSTIASNTAYIGGGVYVAKNAWTALYLGNSIVAANQAPNGPDLVGTFSSADYNLIGNTNGATITGLTAHNIYGQDPKLGSLADLGGPTPAHALRFDSPAVDAGNSGGLTSDQRGLARPIGMPKVEGGDGSDMGAYEADPELRITTIGLAGDDIRLRLNSLLGRNYRVEEADDVTGPWNVLSNQIPGTGGDLDTHDTAGPNLPRRFYRAVLLP